MRLLLDEHFSPRVAKLLRDRGRDATAVADKPDLAGLADADAWQVATLEGRVFVTENVLDFVQLARTAEAAGEQHAGLVLTSPRRFPRSMRAIGALVRALDDLATDHPEDAFAGRVAWLESVPRRPDQT